MPATQTKDPTANRNMSPIRCFLGNCRLQSGLAGHLIFSVLPFVFSNLSDLQVDEEVAQTIQCSHSHKGRAHVYASEGDTSIPISPDWFAPKALSSTYALIRVCVAYWKSIKKMHATVYSDTNVLST